MRLWWYPFIAINLVSVLLQAPPAHAQSIDNLSLYTENYAPLNFEQDGQVVGITVDVLLEMLKRSGSRLARKDIMLVPWARGYNYIQNRSNTGLFAMTRTESREKLFKWVGPIIDANIVLVGRDKPDLALQSLKELENRRTVVVKSDVGHLLLMEKGIPAEAIHVVSQPENAMRMLNIGRVQYWAYGQIVSMWYLGKLPSGASGFKVHHVLKKSQYYYAFNPATKDSILEKLQQALDQMRADGSLNSIISGYLPGYHLG